MTGASDFANPIEPSSRGGQKMADTIVHVVRNHPFGSRCSVVYPQAYPTSILVQTDETDETKTDNTNGTEDNSHAHASSSVLDVPTSAAVIASIRPPKRYSQEAVKNAA